MGRSRDFNVVVMAALSGDASKRRLSLWHRRMSREGARRLGPQAVFSSALAPADVKCSPCICPCLYRSACADAERPALVQISFCPHIQAASGPLDPSHWNLQGQDGRGGSGRDIVCPRPLGLEIYYFV